MKKILLYLTITMCLQSKAQIPGTIDSTFGTNGYTIHYISAANEDVNSNIRIGLNDDILMVGSHKSTDFNPYLLKTDINGIAYQTFGQNGIITYDPLLGANDYGFDVAALPDGKFLIAGMINTSGFDLLLIRVNADGSIDNTFGNNGYNIYNISDDDLLTKMIVINNSIYLGSYSKLSGKNTDNYIIKLKMDGTLDVNYGTSGIVTLDPQNGSEDHINDFQVLDDGSVVATGISRKNSINSQYITRVDKDGNFVSHFGTNGYVLYNESNKLAFHKIKYDGSSNYYIAGYYESNNDELAAIYCFDTSGVLNTSFASGKGKAVLNTGANNDQKFYDIQILNDGSLFAVGSIKTAGNNYVPLAALFSPNGLPDTRFNINGYQQFSNLPDVQGGSFQNILMQQNGQIVAGGRVIDNSFKPGVQLVRFKKVGTTGIIDDNIETPRISCYPNPTSGTFTLKANVPFGQIELYSSNGAKINTFQKTGNNTYRIDDNVPAGMYYISTTTNEGKAIKRVFLNR